MTTRNTHDHNMGIGAHTVTKVGKEVRVLLTCKHCQRTEIIRPHQGRKRDPEFFAKLTTLEHKCCQGPLPIDKPEENAA